jgi:quercetin dioxygenase-like cupin family protein
MTKENRQSPRISVDRTVNIQTGDGSSLACLMSNMSQTGVCLTTNNPSAVPEEFLLLLKDDLKRWCKVQWRTNTQVGVKFAPTPQSLLMQPQNLPHIKSPLESDPTKEVWLCQILLPAKTADEFHRHPGDRWVTVLEGELLFTVKGGETRTLKVGESLYIPRGTIHRNQNASDKPLRTVEFLILDKHKPQTEIIEQSHLYRSLR